MAKMTLLEMTQNILSAMDSDEVNSIGDTIEATQVATIVKETFDEIFSNIDQPNFKGLVELEGLGDVNRPTTMKIPDNVSNIGWVRYNGREIRYIPPEDFLTRFSDRYGNDSLNPYGPYFFSDSQEPTFWTTFNNSEIVFDSFNSAAEETLHANNATCYGEREFVFSLDDNFVPPIGSNQFPLLLAEAKQTCFINLKQVDSAKEAQRSRRQQVRLQNDRWRTKSNEPNSLGPNYGRRTRRSRGFNNPRIYDATGGVAAGTEDFNAYYKSKSNVS